MQSRMNSVIVVALSLVVAVLLSASGAQAALVAEWTFDETSGTTAADATGNGFTATLNGSVTMTAAGAIGNAHTFPGGSNYFSVPTSTSLDGFKQATFCCWVNVASTNLDGRDIFRKWSPGYLVDITNGVNNVIGYVSDGTGGQNSLTFNNAALTTNTWHQLTFVYDGTGGTEKWYLDNTVMASKTFTPGQTMSASSNSLLLGGGDNGFLGGLDDMGIWSEALTAGKAGALYSTPVLFGLGANNLYNLSAMQKLFNVWNNGAGGAGTATVGALTWQFAADGTLPGGHTAGQAWTDGTLDYVQLDASGGGVETGAAGVPEPSTLLLLATGLAGLLCYAWRKRR